jgi:tRNA-specific 2-thiouridylase
MVKGNGETVLIGMNGDMESAVVAYLLKKQGYNCLGLAINYFEKYKDYEELLNCWKPDNLESIKELCDTLDIPFYATNANEIFQDRVIDRVVAAKLGGKQYVPQVDKNLAIVETLLEKRESLGATMVATGHSCKILRNQITGEFSLYAGIDSADDDSFYFSKLPKKYYQYLHFPLAELRHTEIEKVSKLIPYEFKFDKSKRRKKRESFMHNPLLTDLVKELSSEDLRPEGTVYNFYDALSIGDHLGTHQFYIGLRDVPLKYGRPTDRDAEVLRIIPSNGSVFMDNPERLNYTHVYLTDVNFDDDLSRSHILNVFVAFNPRQQVMPCTLYFKNNDSVMLELDSPIHTDCFRGQSVVVYNKKGPGAKVLGGGTVRHSGYFDKVDGYRTLPKTKEEEDQTPESPATKNDLGF